MILARKRWVSKYHLRDSICAIDLGPPSREVHIEQRGKSGAWEPAKVAEVTPVAVTVRPGDAAWYIRLG